MKINKIIDINLLSVDTEEGRLSLFQLSFPIFLNLISSVLISFVQTIAAKRYLDGFFIVPITIVSTGYSLLRAIIMMVGTGTSIILNVNLGEKRHDDCKKIIGTSLIMSVVFSGLIALIGLGTAKPLLTFMGMNKAEYEIFQSYALTMFRVRLVELIAWSVGNVAITCLRCYGYSKVGFFAGLASNLVNILSIVVALFIIKIPKESAALTFSLISVFSAVVFALIGAAYLWKKKIPVDKSFCWKWCKKIFRVGFPAGISLVFYSLSQLVTTSICTQLPQAAYLAKTYAQQITQLIYQFGYSIGQANAVLVGRLCGMGDLARADKMHRQNLRIVLMCNLVLSVMCAILGRQFLRLFFGADESILAFSIVFFIDIAVEIGRGMNHVGENGLNATGDVKFTTVVSVLSCWIFSVGISYLFVTVFGLGLYGMWTAFAIDELFRGTAYYIRWRKQRWKKALLIMTEDEIN